MHTPSDLDPTALCNGCAQAYAADTAPEILALITRIRELEALAGQALHHSDLPPKETAEGWAILGRGVVLP